MSIRRERVQAVMVRYYCDECGAEMKQIGRMRSTFPPSFVHYCTKCQNEEWLREAYPTIDYEPLEPAGGD